MTFPFKNHPKLARLWALRKKPDEGPITATYEPRIERLTSEGGGGLGDQNLKTSALKTAALKTGAKKEEKGYLRQVGTLLPAVAAKSLTDIPGGALESAVENKVLGKAPAFGEAMRLGVSRAGSNIPALATAPIFFSGLKDVQSEDPTTRRKGVAKALAAGTAASYIKGLVEGAGTRGKLGPALSSATSKTIIGVPAALGALYTARSIGKKEQSTRDKYLTGALVGAGANILKGGVEAAWQERALRKLNPTLYRKTILGRGLGRSLGGAVKGVVLTGILDQLMKKSSLEQVSVRR